eukprot:783108-Alexandrium_andersonii.AAC.1
MATVSKKTSWGGGMYSMGGGSAPQPAGLPAERPRRATPRHCRLRRGAERGGCADALRQRTGGRIG